jgi:fructosamine-3-kinase
MDEAAIQTLLNRQGLRVAKLLPVSGGDIHRSYRVFVDDNRSLFVKANHAVNAQVLMSEHQSLRLLADLGAKGYPRAIAYDQLHDRAILVMPWLDLSPLDERGAAKLGQLLAQQHGIHHSHFGWEATNHIGLTRQPNPFTPSWVDFYREQRLAPQWQSAIQAGLPNKLANHIERLMSTLSDFIDDSQIKPSLLHGDLWHGNTAVEKNSDAPVLYDPAPYFGDPEADLAMTRLFGTFSANFYDAYHEFHPQQPDWQQRSKIYNLYHALNHFNLFGRGYLPLVEQYAVL